VCLAPSRLQQWHLRVVDRLAARPGTVVTVAWASGATALPPALAALLAFEKLIYGLPGRHASDKAEPADLARFVSVGDAPADLVIDLSSVETTAERPTWRLTFDGIADQAAGIGALVQGRMPVLAVVDAASGRRIASGRPGTDHREVLALALEDVLARAGLLISAALDGAATRLDDDAKLLTSIDAAALAHFAMTGLASAIAMRLYRLCFYAPHWRVGWRVVDGADVIDQRALPQSGWRELPDDGHRFYADPFPAIHRGRTHLFVEDYDHRLGRGVISAVEFDQRGPIGMPHPVLDTGAHASYPFIFSYRDQMWMVPETVAGTTVDLYRATAYPSGWVKEASLLSGIVASDATLFEHAGCWWMLATVRGEAGSYSDVLHAWSAATPLGPWRPHRCNPVLVDIASARPAGHVVKRGGRLIRPVQNCTDGYGAALGLAEITRLDDETFEQRVDVMLRPGRAWPGRRLHTLNRSGWLECIDGSKSLRKF
jgi:hypothetical protein